MPTPANWSSGSLRLLVIPSPRGGITHRSLEARQVRAIGGNLIRLDRSQKDPNPLADLLGSKTNVLVVLLRRSIVRVQSVGYANRLDTDRPVTQCCSDLGDECSF